MAESVNNTSDYDTKMEVRRMFYKNPIKKTNLKLELDYNTSQEQRRQTLLEFQKRFRDEAFNTTRGHILQEALFSELEDNNTMDVETCLGDVSISSNRPRRRGHQVMLSEWMLDVPQDFLGTWIMVPCPKGKRSLLVASKGITKAYTRKGRLSTTFPSALPGGNSHSNRSNFAIVDCIWNGSQKLYYALDVLAWGNQPTTNCEAEFRLFWINSQIHDLEQLNERNTEINKYPILSLPNIDCNTDLTTAVANFDHLHPLDGFLFYHRNAQYSLGYTPLVAWLKPFMLPEVLGIYVPPPLDKKPDGYIDLKHYICQTTRSKKKKLSENSMEVV